ncbi:MAG: aspartate aminotransferase family protein [bacterium]
MPHDLSHIASVWNRTTDLIIARGEGCYVYTLEGEKYLDFSCGIGVTNTGHCHPRVVRAIQEQAAKAIHAQVNCYFHEPLIKLTHALHEVVPTHLDTFYFSNSGAEAVEGAVKLARHYTGRTNIIVFQGGFHGRTAQAMALTTAKTLYRFNYQPLPAGVFVAPFPYAFRYRMNEEKVSEWALRELDLLLHTQSDPQETAAMLIEPVLGEGGYLPAPARFLQGLRRLCDEHKILLILDEVQSGFCRTGKFFAHEHADIKADLMVMAKGLASGVPISAIAAPQEIMKAWKTGVHGGTYGGNPIACAAAAATIEVMQEEKLAENAAARGRQLLEGLQHMRKRFPVLGEVRGLGLMVGCEFADPESGEPEATLTKKITTLALQQEQLILLTCGAYGNIIRWIPPLVVSAAQIDEALHKFENALSAAVA